MISAFEWHACVPHIQQTVKCVLYCTRVLYRNVILILILIMDPFMISLSPADRHSSRPEQEHRGPDPEREVGWGTVHPWQLCGPCPGWWSSCRVQAAPHDQWCLHGLKYPGCRPAGNIAIVFGFGFGLLTIPRCIIYIDSRCSFCVGSGGGESRRHGHHCRLRWIPSLHDRLGSHPDSSGSSEVSTRGPRRCWDGLGRLRTQYYRQSNGGLYGCTFPPSSFFLYNSYAHFYDYCTLRAVFTEVVATRLHYFAQILPINVEEIPWNIPHLCQAPTQIVFSERSGFCL